MRWNDISIQKKILVIGCSIIAGFVAVMVFYVVPVIERSIYDLKKEKIKDMVDATVTTVEAMYRERGGGADADERFRANAMDYVRRIRYGASGNDYLWINDFHPRMVMHPLRSDLDGRDLTDYRDPAGNRLFVAMADVCRAEGAGYVSYIWQYGNDKNRLEPKISYVRSIPEAGWIPALTGAGLPQHVAEVYAEMYRGFASGAIKPKGDRAIEGKTTIDEVVKKLTQ